MLKRKVFSRKMLSIVLSVSMLTGSVSVLSGCGAKGDKDDVITLDVYSQLANYSGEQTG